MNHISRTEIIGKMHKFHPLRERRLNRDQISLPSLKSYQSICRTIRILVLLKYCKNMINIYHNNNTVRSYQTYISFKECKINLFAYSLMAKKYGRFSPPFVDTCSILIKFGSNSNKIVINDNLLLTKPNEPDSKSLIKPLIKICEPN